MISPFCSLYNGTQNSLPSLPSFISFHYKLQYWPLPSVLCLLTFLSPILPSLYSVLFFSSLHFSSTISPSLFSVIFIFTLHFYFTAPPFPLLLTFFLFTFPLLHFRHPPPFSLSPSHRLSIFFLTFPFIFSIYLFIFFIHLLFCYQTPASFITWSTLMHYKYLNCLFS